MAWTGCIDVTSWLTDALRDETVCAELRELRARHASPAELLQAISHSAGPDVAATALFEMGELPAYTIELIVSAWEVAQAAGKPPQEYRILTSTTGDFPAITWLDYWNAAFVGFGGAYQDAFAMAKDTAARSGWETANIAPESPAPWRSAANHRPDGRIAAPLYRAILTRWWGFDQFALAEPPGDNQPHHLRARNLLGFRLSINRVNPLAGHLAHDVQERHTVS